MELEFQAQTVIDRPPAEVFEFVAVDHLPFDPPVVATASFNVTN